MYRFYTAITETPCVTLDKGEELRIDPEKVIRTIREEKIRLFIFSNPCNPTSLGLKREDVRRIITETDALIVLDEAYMDFWDQSLLDEGGGVRQPDHPAHRLQGAGAGGAAGGLRGGQPEAHRHIAGGQIPLQCQRRDPGHGPRWLCLIRCITRYTGDCC